MANIDIIISGQASSASNSVDTLIGKLTELSNALDNIGNKAKTAFSNFGSGMNTSSLDDFSAKLDNISAKMDQLSGTTGSVRTEFTDTSRNISAVGKAASKSGGFLDKLGKSFGRIAFYRFLRTVLKEITQGFKEGMENAYQFSKITGGPLAAAFDKVKSAGGQMKNQLGAALGTLVQQLQPVINFAINMLTRLAQILTQIFSLFGGSGTYLKATEGNLEDVGNAAGGAGKKVKGLLAAWDELNVIGQDKGGGGGGGNTQDFESMFENAPIEGWLKNLFDASGIPESIERIKKSWEELINAVKNGDFEFGINTFVLDPLRTVIDTLDGIIFLLRGIMSGDLWLVNLGIGKLIFDSLTNTVVIPFTRTIDGIFGTNLTEKVLKFKDDVDNGFELMANPNVMSALRERISKPFKDAWEKVKEIWNKVATWFDEKVVQPIVDFFRPIVEWLGSFFRGAWIIIKGIFIVAANWFNDKVWTPIKEFAVSAINIIRDAFVAFWELIKVPALNAVLWITEKIIEPTAIAFATAFDWVRTALAKVWYTIKSAFAAAVNWIIENVINKIISVMNTIGPFFAKITGDTWTDIKSLGTIAVESFDEIESKSHQAADAVKNAFKGLKQVITDELSADPVINFHYNNAPSGSGKSGDGPTAQLFAEGGYVTTGQLFVAREAGPEMVGSIGSHTAVANNDQIVAGIASGVREAESEQNALLRQQNAILAQLLSKELTISPSAALGQVVARSNALYARS